MRVTNNTNLPEAIVRAVSADPYTRGGADRSVTELVGPPRLAALARQHANDLTEDAADRIWSLVGQTMHEILRRAAVDALTETRLAVLEQDWTISGQFDHLGLLDDTLTDYKVTSVWSVKQGPREEWVAQANLYAHLLRAHGYTVRALQVVALLRDWRKNEALRYAASGYPAQQVVTLPLPLWAPDIAARYLTDRVTMHQAAASDLANGDPLPYCTDAERWKAPARYAVMKPKRQSALRLLASEVEALAWIDAQPAPSGLTVQHRPSVATRCAQYCPVRVQCEARADGQHAPGDLPAADAIEED